MLEKALTLKQLAEEPVRFPSFFLYWNLIGWLTDSPVGDSD